MIQAMVNDETIAAILRQLRQPIVLVGLMGAGKTRIGTSLAKALDLSFTDSDTEIERAAGCSIADYFDRFGEAAFRDGEARVIRRLIDGTPRIIATGGGAVLNPETRAILKNESIAIWLQADIGTLVERTAKSNRRPLLKSGDPHEILTRLSEARAPLYDEASTIKVKSHSGSPTHTVRRALAAIAAHLESKQT